jgi:hypothetical protein
MFVTTWDVFDEYCTWFFDVMKKYDEEIEMGGQLREPRVDGFLAEQLLLIWVNYRFKRKEIYHLEVRNTEEDSWVDYSESFVGRVVKMIRCNHMLLSFARYLRIILLRVKRSEWLHFNT